MNEVRKKGVILRQEKSNEEKEVGICKELREGINKEPEEDKGKERRAI
jgi:hypothetical protein